MVSKVLSDALAANVLAICSNSTLASAFSPRAAAKPEPLVLIRSLSWRR